MVLDFGHEIDSANVYFYVFMYSCLSHIKLASFRMEHRAYAKSSFLQSIFLSFGSLLTSSLLAVYWGLYTPKEVLDLVNDAKSLKEDVGKIKDDVNDVKKDLEDLKRLHEESNKWLWERIWSRLGF